MFENKPLARPNDRLEKLAEQQLDALQSVNAKLADLLVEVRQLSRIIEDNS